MKGLFIPGIDAELFRNGCLESVETLMAEGEIYDIDYPLEQEPVLDKIRAEIRQKIEQERFARAVFRGEEKDVVKANQCTGSIMAYDKVDE